MKTVYVEKNRYVDSVTMMCISDAVHKLDGIRFSTIVTATPASMAELCSDGFDIPADTTIDDLLIALEADNEAQAQAAIQAALDAMDHTGDAGERVYRSLEEVDFDEPPFDLVQVSVPGEYAFDEAKKALERGLNVFIFSDNVPAEQERELKLLGQERGLLVMGPDCGVGLIDGVALAAGSVIRDGPIGIVGASGSGAQEVGCIIERCGLGVSCIIGTGGKDLTPAIGGISMLQGIERLERDSHVQVIVLVSKLADRAVMDKVLTRADSLSKPVVAVFLGADEALFRGHRAHPAYSLEQAALTAAALAGAPAESFGLSDSQIAAIVRRETARYGLQQKYLRALYCGGTFAEEAMLYFRSHNAGTTIYSNLQNPYAKPLADHDTSQGHTVLDLGAEDFTEAAPHPIFDPVLRMKRLERELDDPTVAAVLIDFITGPGVHPDPFTPFVELCRQAQDRPAGAPTFIVNICGSLEDPQNVPEKIKMLEEAGVIVTGSSCQSARLASALLTALEERR